MTEDDTAIDDARGIRWFEQTFGVPLGDKPGAALVAVVRARAASLPAGHVAPEGDLVAEAVLEHWGERCPDFDPDCATCRAWAQLDVLHDRRAIRKARDGMVDASTTDAGDRDDR